LLTDTWHQVRFPFIAAVIGVSLVGVVIVYDAIRSFLVMTMLRPRLAIGAARQLRTVNPFGLTSIMIVVGVIVAMAGLLWLGLALGKSDDNTPKPSQ
jgi:hypothetical protein